MIQQLYSLVKLYWALQELDFMSSFTAARSFKEDTVSRPPYHLLRHRKDDVPQVASSIPNLGQRKNNKTGENGPPGLVVRSSHLVWFA